MSDVCVECDWADRQLTSVKATKRHSAYDQAVKQRQQGEQELRPLEDCWLHCLLYLLAPGGGDASGSGGSDSAGSTDDSQGGGGPAASVSQQDD